MLGRVLDRGEVARSLEAEFDDIESTAKNFCLPDATVAILKLEDVYDDWRNLEYMRMLHPSQNADQDPMQVMVYHRRAMYMLNVCNMTLAILLEHGRECGRKFRNFPHIHYIVSRKFPLQLVNDLHSSGEIAPNDSYFVTTTNILGTYHISEVLSLEGAAGTEVEGFMNSLLALSKKLMVYLAKKRAVSKGKSLRMENTEVGPMLITQPQLSESEIFDQLMKEQATPRHLVGTDWNAATWASNVRDIFRENYKDIDSDRDPAVNLGFVLKEEDEITSSYASFPGFTESFSKTHGIRYESFSKINRVLMTLVMQSDQHVYYGSLQKTLAKLHESTQMSKNECEKVLAFLTFRRGENPIRFPIYSSGLYRYTSFRRLSAARTLLLDSHFFGVYGHEDEKGQIFEEKIRELLRGAAFNVYPSRLNVPFQIVPCEVSQELWGKVKRETDFDVLATFGEIGFVIECKETKPPFQKLIKKTNLFEKFIKELYNKTTWISENRQRFIELLEKNSNLFDGVKFLLPLIITTFPFDIDISLISLLTYSELDLISKAAKEIKVEKGAEGYLARLPWSGVDSYVRTLALDFTA